MSSEEPESLPDRLFGDLRRLYELEDSRTRSAWERSLPVVEAVSDRWQRAQALGFGEGTSVYHHCYVFGDVRVGEHTIGTQHAARRQRRPADRIVVFDRPGDPDL